MGSTLFYVVDSLKPNKNMGFVNVVLIEKLGVKLSMFCYLLQLKKMPSIKVVPMGRGGFWLKAKFIDKHMNQYIV